jgi:hypothetical protein
MMEKFEMLKSDQFEKLDEEDVCESVVGTYFGFALEKKNTCIVSQRGKRGLSDHRIASRNYIAAARFFILFTKGAH